MTVTMLHVVSPKTFDLATYPDDVRVYGLYISVERCYLMPLAVDVQVWHGAGCWHLSYTRWGKEHYGASFTHQKDAPLWRG